MLTGVGSAIPVVEIPTPVMGVCQSSGRPPQVETYFLQCSLFDNKLELAMTVSASPLPLLS